jgi:predicted CoA-binding protein
MSIRVGILGASDRPERYACMAALRLQEAGHELVLVNPSREMMLGQPCWSCLSEPGIPIHTITVYVRPERLDSHLFGIGRCAPSRIIFNPGSEAPFHYPTLKSQGIEVVEACTLVMLEQGTFC